MDGIIIINKEKSWTSNDIVQKIKHICHEKVGHAGTLDPLATGVLPILVGKGTLLSKYLINHDKEYISTIKLGQKRDTGDSEGKVIEEKYVDKVILQRDNIEKVLKTFIGKQTQIPPMYSAIKVKGKKLYEYARKGEQINVTPREIEIYAIELVSILEEAQEIKFKVKCSKGTYIRTLSEDIALKLGTVGYMKELERTQVGDFYIDKSVKILDIEKDGLEKYLITIEDFFKSKEKIVLEDIELKRFLNGVKIKINRVDEIYKIYDKNLQFIGIGQVNGKLLKRDICINQ